MPKCLDCSNTSKFSYEEGSYNEAEYNEAGDLVDVTYKTYDAPYNGICLVCQSNNIEGRL